MQNKTLIFAAIPVFGLAVVALAQTPSRSHVTLGKTTLDSDSFHVNLHSFDSLLTGRVTVTSPDYDLKADSVKVFGAPGGTAGRPMIAKVVATGDAARGTQVVGHFDQAASDRRYTMQADQAVYVPDGSRPGGGSIDLTGHPQVTVVAPKELAGPSVTVADHITVLLGSGDDYPQIQGENGHMTLTPLQPSQK